MDIGSGCVSALRKGESSWYQTENKVKVFRLKRDRRRLTMSKPQQ